MEIVNFQKDQVEGGLRLVPESPNAHELTKLEQQFVNFMFFHVNPEWRKLSLDEKRAFKDEFAAVYERYSGSMLLFSYSLVGLDSKADLMFWRIGNSMDQIQEMTAELYRTDLGRYLETAHNYLAVTRSRMFVSDSAEDRKHVLAGTAKYHFFYPCSKQREWHEMQPADRDAMIEENYMVGMRFPNIKIHMTYAFGFSEQEYLISFETDEPRDFLALAEELRETQASKYTLRGMPIFTCRQRTLIECLDALG